MFMLVRLNLYVGKYSLQAGRQPRKCLQIGRPARKKKPEGRPPGLGLQIGRPAAK